MRARSIFCIAILVAVVFEECSSLRGGEDAVCRVFSYPPGFNDDSDFETDDSFSGDHADDDNDEEMLTRAPMASHENMIMIEKCCEGYLDNGGTCEPQCESGCENGHCLRPGECACNVGYEETSPNTCNPICDPKCINGYCTSPNQCTCDGGYRLSADGFTCEPICSPPCEFGASCTAPENCSCDDGFVRDEAEHGSCVPTCRTSCNQGVCAFGWVGESCDEPLFCTVIQPADVSIGNEQDPSAKLTMTKIEDENYQFRWKGPTCHKQCLDQLNTTAVGLTRTSRIMTQYFFPINSSCNVIEVSPEPSMWNSRLMWTVIGIAATAIVIVIGVILMRIRQRSRIM